MTRRRCWILAMLLVAGLLGGLYGTRGILLPAMGRWLDVGQPPQPSDYVMVLGGGEDIRPFVAAALVKAGFARKVLASTSAVSPENEAGLLPPCHEIIRQVLLCRGVPPDSILLLDHESVHTFDETQALAHFLESVPACRVIVVTSDFHTRRSRWAASRILGDRASRVSFVSAPSDDFVLDHWWQTERGFEAVTSEYLKLAFYLVRYSLTWVAAVTGMVLLMIVAAVYRRHRARSRQPISTTVREVPQA